MDLPGHFRAMARNNAWSNQRLHRACAALQPGEWEAVRTGFFPSLQRTLNHILIVDWYYLDALEKGGQGCRLFANEVPCPALADLIAAQRATDRRLVRFCDALDADGMAARVILERPGRLAPPETVAAVLSHLLVHQIHHRGQAHAMLSGSSVAPPQLDEFFLEDDARFRQGEISALGL